MAAPKKKGAGGRPCTYTPEIGERICELIAEGRTLLATSKIVGHKRHTIVKWARTIPEFGAMYAEARKLLYEHWADEIVEDALNETRDQLERKRIKQGNTDKGSYDEVVTEIVSDNTAVQRDRLKVDSKKWLLSKLLPKEYGDKIQQEVTGADGAAFVPVINITVAKK